MYVVHAISGLITGFPAYYEEEDCKCVKRLFADSISFAPISAVRRFLTISALTANKTHGGKSHEVSNR